ncbi:MULTISPECIES: decaprenyl-phosphate phosphoribosyltransferase [unclassified Leptolyngbya]|uniref:decaprenyl-phosphate phosphoribosyltransferase n=1 Tax=unclassified Leptolyngbya TaxID=2650499 RepID=UPI0016845851|nr:MULTISPECIES: decaprenyl-phosphate phosphoribosyltransferase [unclassified Leptolyngbya]MBD1912507.1 decaprenyl-phosphate phosphoribosyltransferase [Leptolyngbya sp. FACHB-8]MBD2156482.1 decaprenyl-phosphate phosphoribosyltransferase [Leptolyngbya sp. FACHB-16]
MVSSKPKGSLPSSEDPQPSHKKVYASGIWVAYLKALRPRQWTKNLIIFAAPLFAFAINWRTISGSLLAFTLFCCISSSFYLINDLMDVEADRRHPVKCKRPIAAGLISIPTAITMAILLMGGALLVGGLYTPMLSVVLACYAVLQVAYNLRLKHTVVLDVIAIASGFVLRALAGGVATSITLSSWFLLCTAMLALFLAIEKRKAEMRLAVAKGGSSRAVLRRYSLFLLQRMEGVVTAGAILTYTLWSSGPEVGGASTSWMLLTVPFVLYGIFRYQFLSDPKEIRRRQRLEGSISARTERPDEVLLSDLPILLTVVSWIVVTTGILALAKMGVL